MGLLVIQEWQESRVVDVPMVSYLIVPLPIILNWGNYVLQPRVVHEGLSDIVQEVAPEPGETSGDFLYALVWTAHGEVVVNFILAKVAVLDNVL